MMKFQIVLNSPAISSRKKNWAHVLRIHNMFRASNDHTNLWNGMKIHLAKVVARKISMIRSICSLLGDIQNMHAYNDNLSLKTPVVPWLLPLAGASRFEVNQPLISPFLGSLIWTRDSIQWSFLDWSLLKGIRQLGLIEQYQQITTQDFIHIPEVECRWCSLFLLCTFSSFGNKTKDCP